MLDRTARRAQRFDGRGLGRVVAETPTFGLLVGKFRGAVTSSCRSDGHLADQRPPHASLKTPHHHMATFGCRWRTMAGQLPTFGCRSVRCGRMCSRVEYQETTLAQESSRPWPPRHDLAQEIGDLDDVALESLHVLDWLPSSEPRLDENIAAGDVLEPLHEALHAIEVLVVGVVATRAWPLIWTVHSRKRTAG